MGRRSRINYDNTAAFKQANLFETKSARRELAGLPSLERSYSGYDEIATRRTGPIGLDLEFNPTTNKATIMSVSAEDLIVATPFNREVLAGTIEACVKQGRKIVGHSVIGADRPVLKNMGIETELDDWRDTMLEHYVLSHDWTKNPAKKEDDEGALGFMGLWSMCSYYTDLWMWKECPGATCDGELCPTHDPEGYCGVDSWAGLKSHLEMQPRLNYWGVPEGFVKDIHELAFMCHTMQQRGVKVDYERVQVLQDDMEAKKALLFPETEHGYQWFNPKSPKQIQEWFLSRKIVLRDTDKESIKKVVQKKFKQLGIEQGEMPALEAVEDFRKNGGDAPEEIEVLARLYDLKNKGKGLKAWFDDKYRNRDKLIHPRFIVTGTCTGRLSSSRPNFQNISARGWGKLVKSCIVPRDPSLIFVESDFSQLELRVCLFLSGIDPAVIGADAFKWLVAKGNGAFEDAAKGSSLTGRDLAKISSHASNYMEGLVLLSGADLNRSGTKSAIAAGALFVYNRKINPAAPFDWDYCGKVVAFTGANLAERLYRDKSFASRKKALDIQEGIYFKNFPDIRRWQKETLTYIQDHRHIKSPIGRFLRLYGTPEDNAKTGVAFLGQGVGADHVQGIMMLLNRGDGRIPLLQVHDSLVYEIPQEWGENHKQIREWMQPMYGETWRLTGFSCPGKIKVGRNYGERFDDKKVEINPGGLEEI